MRVAALTRFKQGDLYLLLKKLGWTQVELARRTGIAPVTIGGIINLIRRPTLEQANKIQTVFGEAGHFVNVIGMFPDTFVGFEKAPVIEQVKDLGPDQLKGFAAHQEMLLEDASPPIPSEIFTNKDTLEMALAVLSDRERDVIETTVMKGAAASEVCKRWPIDTKRVYQIRNTALRKMRNVLYRQYPASVERMLAV